MTQGDMRGSEGKSMKEGQSMSGEMRGETTIADEARTNTVLGGARKSKEEGKKTTGVTEKRDTERKREMIDGTRGGTKGGMIDLEDLEKARDQPCSEAQISELKGDAMMTPHQGGERILQTRPRNQRVPLQSRSRRKTQQKQ